MKVIDSIRRELTRLLTAPHQELGRWARLVQFQIQMWRFCARRLGANNAMAMSAALSFRTIFAMVPVLVLAVVVMKSVGFAEDGKRVVKEVVLKGLSRTVYLSTTAPGATSRPSGDSRPAHVTVADQIESVMETVEKQLTLGRLGPVGAALLIWTALTLLTTVERCLNRIFEAPRSRSTGRRILLYWSAVTLGPLAMLLAVYVADGAVAAFQNVPYLSWLTRWAGRIGSVLVAVALLGALYSLMPNTHVRFRTAAKGAVVAVPLWLLAQWAFRLYVQKVGSQSIYGAIGLLPLFLLWLNLLWLIFLFGAELAHTAANLRRMESTERAERRVLSSWDFLAAALAVARGHLLGRGPVTVNQVAAGLDLPPESAERLLMRLAETDFVTRVADTEAGAFVPARPAGTIRVADVMRAACPDTYETPQHTSAPEVARAVAAAGKRAGDAMADLTLAEILAETT